MRLKRGTGRRARFEIPAGSGFGAASETSRESGTGVSGALPGIGAIGRVALPLGPDVDDSCCGILVDIGPFTLGVTGTNGPPLLGVDGLVRGVGAGICDKSSFRPCPNELKKSGRPVVPLLPPAMPPRSPSSEGVLFPMSLLSFGVMQPG